MDSSRPPSEPAPPPGVVPLPANFAAMPGRFDLGRIRSIAIDTEPSALREVAYFLARELGNLVGRFVKCASGASGSDRGASIILTTAIKKPYLGAEGYELEVGPDGATIAALHAHGLIRGAFTLLQSIDRSLAGEITIAATRAIDKPSVPWRALRLDVSKGACPPAWLSRMIEVAATLRMNGVRIAVRAGTPRPPWHDDLASRCSERGLELVVEQVASENTVKPFRLVRLTAPANFGASATNLPAEELEISDAPLPSVEEIHAWSPEAYALAAEHRCFGLEAWIDWIPGAGEALLERAYLTRLAAFSEVAWTGPFRRTFADFRDRLARLFVAFDRIGVDYDVPPPLGLPELLDFDSECAIDLIPPLPGSCVEYTLDGKDPSTGSPIATAPLFIREDAELRVRTRLPNGKTSTVVRTTLRQRRPPDRPGDRNSNLAS